MIADLVKFGKKKLPHRNLIAVKGFNPIQEKIFASLSGSTLNKISTS